MSLASTKRPEACSSAATRPDCSPDLTSSAIDAQDYEAAALLRDREKQLVDERDARQEEWATAQVDVPSLSDEVEQLRELLRRHGIEPQGGAA